jgi:predicted ArsR family transcriptional regulator
MEPSVVSLVNLADNVSQAVWRASHVSSTDSELERVIRSADQLVIARMFLREAQSSKDWLNLRDIAKTHGLSYLGCRQFMLTLVKRRYTYSRRMKTARPPLDFKFTSEGYTKLMQEYLAITSRTFE